jgi:hypothetical protein
MAKKQTAKDYSFVTLEAPRNIAANPAALKKVR